MRTIPAELVKRYEAEGWWTRDTIGDLLARGLGAAPEAEFRVHSAVRPWSGTFGEVERIARRLAAGLRERGVGPGDVVAFQLPNWMEAAAVFWASAKWPEELRAVEEFPRTASGKIQKFVLRKDVAGRRT